MSGAKHQAGLIDASLDDRAAAALLPLAGDISLLLERDGTILDVMSDDARLLADARSWIGRSWASSVTIEGRGKIAELIEDAAAGRPSRRRQVTHILSGGEMPVRYACIPAGDRLVAVGRDMRDAAAMQQRLLQAQQSLERDYLRLRQAEGRYRLLFDLPDEATFVVDAGSWRIVEANPAAHRLLNAAPGTLIGQPIGSVAQADGREGFLAFLGTAAVGLAATTSVPLTARGGTAVQLASASFRQDRSTFLLLRMTPTDGEGAPASDGGLQRVVERMPDAFVLTGRSLAVITANTAFLDMVGAPSPEAVVGQPLSSWLGRSGVDVEIILTELRKAGVVRNAATILRGSDGGQDEVELSAVHVEGAGEEHYGFVLRSVARRLRDLPPTGRDLPRSVEQLTELVGRLSLKEIVRESTDLIERLCIEAALTYTADNRASAAELLGLSRQGLYTKLHRHGIGNLVGEE